MTRRGRRAPILRRNTRFQANSAEEEELADSSSLNDAKTTVNSPTAKTTVNLSTTKNTVQSPTAKTTVNSPTVPRRNMRLQTGLSEKEEAIDALSPNDTKTTFNSPTTETTTNSPKSKTSVNSPKTKTSVNLPKTKATVISPTTETTINSPTAKSIVNLPKTLRRNPSQRLGAGVQVSEETDASVTQKNAKEESSAYPCVEEVSFIEDTQMTPRKTRLRQAAANIKECLSEESEGKRIKSIKDDSPSPSLRVTRSTRAGNMRSLSAPASPSKVSMRRNQKKTEFPTLIATSGPSVDIQEETLVKKQETSDTNSSKNLNEAVQLKRGDEFVMLDSVEQNVEGSNKRENQAAKGKFSEETPVKENSYVENNTSIVEEMSRVPEREAKEFSIAIKDIDQTYTSKKEDDCVKQVDKGNSRVCGKTTGHDIDKCTIKNDLCTKSTGESTVKKELSTEITNESTVKKELSDKSMEESTDKNELNAISVDRSTNNKELIAKRIDKSTFKNEPSAESSVERPYKSKGKLTTEHNPLYEDKKPVCLEEPAPGQALSNSSNNITRKIVDSATVTDGNKKDIMKHTEDINVALEAQNIKNSFKESDSTSQEYRTDISETTEKTTELKTSDKTEGSATKCDVGEEKKTGKESLNNESKDDRLFVDEDELKLDDDDDDDVSSLGANELFILDEAEYLSLFDNEEESKPDYGTADTKIVEDEKIKESNDKKCNDIVDAVKKSMSKKNLIKGNESKSRIKDNGDKMSSSNDGDKKSSSSDGNKKSSSNDRNKKSLSRERNKNYSSGDRDKKNSSYSSESFKTDKKRDERDRMRRGSNHFLDKRKRSPSRDRNSRRRSQDRSSRRNSSSSRERNTQRNKNQNNKRIPRESHGKTLTQADVSKKNDRDSLKTQNMQMQCDTEQKRCIQTVVLLAQSSYEKKLRRFESPSLA
ncbi:hypothetical protein SK128_002182 [Halocaridina rubra]|uniref:Uncharacterized protein n=1 Tax=Halocaridina rubra TaxID=373956 RepID=A0AAN8WVN7_HALRR